MNVSPPNLDVIECRRKSGTKFFHSVDERSFQAGLMLVMYDDGLLFFAIQQIVKEYGSDWKDHMSHDETMSVLQSVYTYLFKVRAAALARFKETFPHVLPLKAEMFSQENASGLAAEVSDWTRSNAPRAKWKVQLIAGVPLIGF